MFDQPSLFSTLPLSVTEVTRHLRLLLEADELLADVWVRGEVSNLSRPRSGHVYFTLKDSSAALRCVVWKTNAMRLPLSLQDGMAVEAHGAVGIYERDGQYQLYVDVLRSAGAGRLFQEFMRLKARLEEEGLFDEERKRPLPERPKRVGIVTSSTAAALQDVLNTLRGRNRMIEVFLSPASVQGDSAPAEIVEAIARLNREAAPDVILLVRGGGSLEDLWAFNDERVVRAVVASRAPVVSGVGHETDFTLADFAADLRAPTPTGAAVLAVPEMGELAAGLQECRQRLNLALSDLLLHNRHATNQLHMHLQQLSPRWQVQNGRQRMDELQERMHLSAQRGIASRNKMLKSFEERLAALNPLSILQRGYALVLKQDGTLVSSQQQVQVDEAIRVRLADGSLNARVEAKDEK